MSKKYLISRDEVQQSWEAVVRAAGGPGLDGKTIQEIASKLEGELYKVWNRLSSASYHAQPVKLVSIPKAKGGIRHLGVPTVSDRIAQGVIKNRLEQSVEPHFHEDSYAYRPGKSAIEAVLKARERCFQRDWVVEIDIEGFFDNLDHELMQTMLERYTEDKVVLLYGKRFLTAKCVDEKGKEIMRDKGTPQGGVLSPVLANLYLHEAFDSWMKQYFPEIQFERYADDIILHCVSEKQARYLLHQVETRLKTYRLTLHPSKTRVVYAGRSNEHDHRGHGMPRKFTFLGYDFKPRFYKGKLVFTPGMGTGALLRINQVLKRMRIGSRTHKTVESLAAVLNPKLRGWVNYYGRARPSTLYHLATLVDKRLVKWLKQKFKLKAYGKRWDQLKLLKSQSPSLFYHWHGIKLLTQRAV